MNPNPRSFMSRLIFPVGIAALLSPLWAPSPPRGRLPARRRSDFHPLNRAEPFTALNLRASYTADSTMSMHDWVVVRERSGWLRREPEIVDQMAYKAGLRGLQQLRQRQNFANSPGTR